MFTFLYEYLGPLLIVLTALQRGAELVRSRANQSEMRRAGFVRVDSPASYRCMVLVHSTWFMAIAAERLFLGWTPSPAIFYAALFVFLIAQCLRVWTIRSLGTQWNVQVMSPSTGNSDPGVVVAGPYRFIRHPNYLAVIVEFISLPLLAGAPFTSMIWSLLNGSVLHFRIRSEEKHLMQRPGYSSLFCTTPRLIPLRLCRAKGTK